MPDNIQFKEGDEYIRVTSHGIIKQDNILETFSKFNQILDQYNINKVLVDTTQVTSIPSITEIYDTMGSKLPLSFRVAIIVSADQNNIRADMLFAEDVARNRGRNLFIFDEEEKALEWLLDQ